MSILFQDTTRLLSKSQKIALHMFLFSFTAVLGCVSTPSQVQPTPSWRVRSHRFLKGKNIYIYTHIHGVPCYFLSSRLLQPLPPEKPMRVATPKSERRESPSALHPFAATVARLASFPSSGFPPEAVIRSTTKSTCVHLWGAKAWKRAHVVTGVDFVCETPTGTLSLFFLPSAAPSASRRASRSPLPSPQMS